MPFQQFLKELLDFKGENSYISIYIENPIYFEIPANFETRYREGEKSSFDSVKSFLSSKGGIYCSERRREILFLYGCSVP